MVVVYGTGDLHLLHEHSKVLPDQLGGSVDYCAVVAVEASRLPVAVQNWGLLTGPIEVLTALDKGGYITSTKETVGAFLEHWLESYGATNTSPPTLKDYRGIVRRYLTPVLGDTPLVALRPGHIQDLYAYMQGQGLSRRTILHTHRLLRQALSHAVKWGLLGRNVCDSATPPRPARTDMVAMDAETVERFETACEVSAFGDLFNVALRTGLRRSEILAVKWDSVDLEKRTFRVVAGLHRLPQQGMVLLPTKTAKPKANLRLARGCGYSPQHSGQSACQPGGARSCLEYHGVCVHQARW